MADEEEAQGSSVRLLELSPSQPPLRQRRIQCCAGLGSFLAGLALLACCCLPALKASRGNLREQVGLESAAAPEAQEALQRQVQRLQRRHDFLEAQLQRRQIEQEGAAEPRQGRDGSLSAQQGGAWSLGPPHFVGSYPADEPVQKLVQEQRGRAPSLLRTQGWRLEPFGDFRAKTYCRLELGGIYYAVKVTTGGQVRIAYEGLVEEVLQLVIFRPLGLGAALLLAAAVVRPDDELCVSAPLPPPTDLPHLVLNASRDVQLLCDAVKESVPGLLLVSGWRLPDLAPYRALSFCSDGSDVDVRLHIEYSNGTAHPRALARKGLVLQLRLSVVPTPPKGARLRLMGAVMVTPLEGSCAALPLLPPPWEFVTPEWPKHEPPSVQLRRMPELPSASLALLPPAKRPAAERPARPPSEPAQWTTMTTKPPLTTTTEPRLTTAEPTAPKPLPWEEGKTWGEPHRGYDILSVRKLAPGSAAPLAS